MAESKIEKQETGPDFVLLYEKAVKKINATNIPITVLSDELKQKFLNFYNVPHNEQLELISELSTREDLPQEMKDAINQFPYFHTLPQGVFTEIGSYLKKKESPKKDKDMSAFVATHKRPHALFQPGRLGDLLALLLMDVARGKQDEAEKIVDMHPELQLRRGTITDYSGRTFKDISAYEYAYWAKDTHMRRMLEKHMDAKTKAAMLKRCEDIEKHGLTYVQHGVEVKGSKHFDLIPLKNALKNYIDGYHHLNSTNNWTALGEAWMQVGIAQRDVPVHVANEYCWRDRPFIDRSLMFKEDTLPRNLTFCVKITDEAWYPLVISDSTGLGVNYAIIRRIGGGVATEVVDVEWARRDLKDIDLLDEIRTDDLKHSCENLMLVEFHLNHDFPCS